jgi:isocitrate/isopropylmalate dehydrogenase
MMLRHLGEARAAERVEAAVRAALAEGRTRDAGGSLSTGEFADLVTRNVA